MQLSILQSRIEENIPEEYHEVIAKEFEKFEIETSRMSSSPEKIGQATLTQKEINKACLTNQYGSKKGLKGHTVIELQCIKAVAIEYGVNGWMSYVDPHLTMGENVDIIKSKTDNTMKKYAAKEKEYLRQR